MIHCHGFMTDLYGFMTDVYGFMTDQWLYGLFTVL